MERVKVHFINSGISRWGLAAGQCFSRCKGKGNSLNKDACIKYELYVGKEGPQNKGTLRAQNIPYLESIISRTNWAMVGNDMCSQGQVFFVYYMGCVKMETSRAH